MHELFSYACQVRDGIVEDPTFVPVIFQAPEDADPWSEETWFACNPALGDFRSLEEMQMAAARAQRMPAAESTFRSLYLNQMVDAEVRFLSSADWLAGKDAQICAASLKGRKCWAGLDLSSTKDLTALVLVFPGATRTDVLSWFWLPGDELAEEVATRPAPAGRRHGHLRGPVLHRRQGDGVHAGSVAGRWLSARARRSTRARSR
jgi:phage terminase large subunit-like protein